MAPENTEVENLAEAPALVIPPEQDLRDADPEQVAALRSMMGNTALMFEFAKGKGWTDEQVHTWLANQGNVNYVLTVGLGLALPQPRPEPPPPPEQTSKEPT
jgi:hypothetical protein